MANPTTLIAVQHDSGHSGATVVNKYLRTSSDKMGGISRLMTLFGRILGGTHNAKVTVLVDTDGGFGTQTIAFTQASLTAGDVIYIGPVGLRGVAGAATAYQDTFSIDTSDTAVGDSFVTAITNNSFLSQYISASNASGTVTLTSKLPGPICHMFAVRKEVTTAAGVVIDGSSTVKASCLKIADGTGVKATGSVKVVFASAADGDTVTIAGTAFVAETDPVVTGLEFALDTDSGTTATDLARVINETDATRCHFKATLTTTTDANDTVVITALVPGTGLDAATIAVSNATGFVKSAATLTDGVTSAAGSARSYSRGV